ncbi:hypothetical protein SDC9_81562 [bioreactor metagenome]|uniref:Uncharacterized protein n=1 Tax=bioreactor metagenome TaxID=1076179 RepID=A0A644Z2H9_9ZZZZ
MIKNGIHIRRENRLVIVIDRHSGIGPPKEGLGKRCPVIHLCPDLDIGPVRVKRDAVHPFQAGHALHFVAPDGLAPVRVLFYHKFDRIKGAGAMMLRPVKFNPPGYPRAGQAHQGRFDHLVIINNMGIPYLVVSHLDTPSQFGQDHHLQVSVFKKKRLIAFILFLVINFFNHRIGIYRPRATLIDPFFQKNRIFFFFPHCISRQRDIFHPCFYNMRIVDCR